MLIMYTAQNTPHLIEDFFYHNFKKETLYFQVPCRSSKKNSTA